MSRPDPETVEIKVADLRIGDKMDLESCHLTKDDPVAPFEFGVVMELEKTPDDLIIIGFENVSGAYRLLPTTNVRIVPRGGAEPEPFVWVRVGDGGDYEHFDSLDEAAGYLADHDVTPEVERCDQYGIQLPEYRGNNHVSIYFAHQAEAPLRSLTEEEIGEFVEALIRAVRERT